MNVAYRILLPELVVASGAVVVLLFDLRLAGWWRQIAGLISLGTVAAAFVSVLVLRPLVPTATLANMFVLDGFALVVKGFFLAVAAIVVLLSMPYMRGHRYEGEYYFLLLSSVLGTLLMGSSRDLIMLFIALELVSIPAFVIAGLRKHDPRSNEAALKFFLFGVLSAGLFAYGISLVYGFARSTDLAEIGRRAAEVREPAPLLLVAILLIFAAFGFKVSGVPFHFWAPDTYEGSPVPLAAFLSVASKGAGFVGLALIVTIGFPTLAAYWSPVLAAICAATMTVGNVLALRQRHLVRLLAYSSIAQAGYMLIPVTLIGTRATQSGASAQDLLTSLTVYLLMYAAMNLGAFAVAVGLSKQYPTMLIRDLTGLSRRAPFHAAAMTVFLISLGGIPPLAGWAAKFFVFLGAVNFGSLGVGLAILMVLNSVISLYYYVGIARAMYLRPPEEEGAVAFSRLVTAAVVVCAVAVLFLGAYPEVVVRIAKAATLALP